MSERNDDLLDKCLRQFEEAYDNSREERALSEQCRDYYDGNQYTAEERETLRKRKQPIVTSNRIKPKIDALIGFEKKSRTDPKAFPRTPKHEHEAESATDALRFIADQNKFTTIRSDVAENLFIEGSGAATVSMKQRPDGSLDVVLTQIPWDRLYRDPHSRMRDFSDAGYLGVVLWMDDADAKLRFKGKDAAIDASYLSAEAAGETYDDRPKVTWCDKARKRIRVMQHRWLEDGVWHTAILCRGGFLRDPQPSPYLDEWGQPECDVIAVSAFVTRENVRYGTVPQMLSPQDEINKRRSKALHRLSMRQVIAEDGAVENVSAARRELARPDGYVKVRPKARFEVVDSTQSMMGELQLLQEAKAEIDASGVNPAIEGDVKAPSGRAVEALQQSGLQELAIPFDALREWSLRMYRACWNRVRQYWTEEKWVRVTDDESNLRWVGINKPVTVQDELKRLQEAGEQPSPQLLQLAQIDPTRVLRIENAVAQLDVDIIVDEGPDSVTIQSEQFQALVELKRADPNSISTDMIIEASSLRNKDRILEKMKEGGVPPQVQQQMQQLQEQLQALQQKLQQADQQLADRSLDAQKLQTEQFRAETDRFEAITDRAQQAMQMAPVGVVLQ